MTEKSISQKSELEKLRTYVRELTFFLPLAFARVDLRDHITGCSQPFQGITGYREVELIGSTPHFLFKELGKMDTLICRVTSKKSTVESQMTLINKEKREIPVKVSALSTLTPEGEVDGYFLTIIDITESKRAEEDLERKVQERTQELEKAKKRLEETERILEVKVRARTKELEEMQQKTEEKLKEKDKELKEKEEEIKELKERIKELEGEKE